MDFSDNATVCVYNDATAWYDTGCNRTLDTTNNLLTCTCNSVEKAFYAIVFDANRLWSEPEVIYEWSREFDPEIYAVIIFVGFLAIFLPCIAICLDRKDYEEIRSEWVK